MNYHMGTEMLTFGDIEIEKKMLPTSDSYLLKRCKY